MEAVVLAQDKINVLSDFPSPPDTDGEIPIRITSAGICETDLQLVKGYMGFQGVLGHEFVGVAETGAFEGKRVVGEINCPCGKCELCGAGHGNHCPNRSVLGILNRNGAFAERTSLPEANLLAVPDSVTDEEAVFTEPLAAAFRIPEQIEFKGTERVLVLGDGRLGNLCAQVLQLFAAQVMVAGRHDEKLQILRSLHITTSLVDELDHSHDWDIVVDCTGRSGGLEAALQFVRPLGTIVLKTTVAGPHNLPMSPVVIDEVQIVGSRCGPFKPALEALQKRTVNVLPLISRRYPIRNAVEAFESAKSTQCLKTLLEIRQS